MSTKILRNYVAKKLYEKGGTIANRKSVDFSTAAMAERLTEFGIDPRLINSESELIGALNIVKQMQDKAFDKQFGGMLKGSKFDKRAEVFDLEGKKIPNPEKNIMGGQAFETEDEIAKGLSDKEFRSEKTSFRLNISKNSPEFNQDLAKRIINREIYTDLSDSQRKQFLDDLDFVLKNPRDGNAQGGRAGFKSGLSKLFKEFMERRKFLKTMVGNTEKNRKARELQMLKEAMENARKNPGFEFPSGKELRTDLEKKIGPILLKDRTLNSDGGRAGFSRGGSGILKFLQNILKPKKSRIFDEERFRKGPIDMDFLENIDKKDLEKFITTRDTGGRGGYGMYDNFKDMPAGLRAAELISTIKGPRNEINYKAAELFLGKKLRGDESADELIQILNRQEMRAEGGRIGYADGTPSFEEYMQERQGIEKKENFERLYKEYLEDLRRKGVMEQKQEAKDGGRIGLKDGMDRRTFLKIMGGLASIPILGKFFKGAKVVSKAAPVAKTVSKSEPPPYFFELAETIKKFGRVSDGPQERIKIHSMPAKDGKSELMLTEDIGTGEMQIKKISKENDEMVTEVQTMDYAPSSALSDESGKVAGQYDEYTEYNSRIYKDEYNEPDIVDGIKVDEIIDEVKEAPSIKKAAGGIARMLGE